MKDLYISLSCLGLGMLCLVSYWHRRTQKPVRTSPNIYLVLGIGFSLMSFGYALMFLGIAPYNGAFADMGVLTILIGVPWVIPRAKRNSQRNR